MFLHTKLTFTGLSLGLLAASSTLALRNSRNLQLRIRLRGPKPGQLGQGNPPPQKPANP